MRRTFIRLSYIRFLAGKKVINIQAFALSFILALSPQHHVEFAENQITPMVTTNNTSKSLESWIWDAGCSSRGAKDALKYKEFILPLIFAKRFATVLTTN